MEENERKFKEPKKKKMKMHTRRV